MKKKHIKQTIFTSLVHVIGGQLGFTVVGAGVGGPCVCVKL
jgi:hypothetical protein